MTISVEVERVGTEVDGKLEMRISATMLGTSGTFFVGEEALSADMAASLAGQTIARILRRFVSVDLPPIPENSKSVEVGVSWVAFSVVELSVPIEAEETTAGLREHVQLALRENPGLVSNPTTSLMSLMDAYAPREPSGFVVDPEHQIEL